MMARTLRARAAEQGCKAQRLHKCHVTGERLRHSTEQVGEVYIYQDPHIVIHNLIYIYLSTI